MFGFWALLGNSLAFHYMYSHSFDVDLVFSIAMSISITCSRYMILFWFHSIANVLVSRELLRTYFSFAQAWGFASISELGLPSCHGIFTIYDQHLWESTYKFHCIMACPVLIDFSHSVISRCAYKITHCIVFSLQVSCLISVYWWGT